MKTKRLTGAVLPRSVCMNSNPRAVALHLGNIARKGKPKKAKK